MYLDQFHQNLATNTQIYTSLIYNKNTNVPMIRSVPKHILKFSNLPIIILTKSKYSEILHENRV